MERKRVIDAAYYTEERPLFRERNLRIENTIFSQGESPLKECGELELEQCVFEWKYPLWYADHITAKDCVWKEMGRAGVWYSRHVAVRDALIEAPKNFRRCRDVELENVRFTNAQETLWNCEDVRMRQVTANGDYFAMNSRNLRVDGLELVGNYSFDGAVDVEIHNARMLSKDAFWNSEHVTVYDSFISGEYLGWNAKHLTLVNCTIESLQGLCYIEDLVMRNCKLLHTQLAFEYSTVDAAIHGKVDSVFNPKGGIIRADAIGQLIMERDRIDPNATQIVCDRVEERLEDGSQCLILTQR